MEQRSVSIGIDLGTAYTRVASFDGNNWKMIPDDYSESAMPSYVAFTDSGVLVGRAARMQASQNPANTIFDVIRLIGRRSTDPSVRNDIKRWPFKVVACQRERLLVEVQWKGKLWHFTPVEICSMILTQIKENAETNLEITITDAVVTVPVHFSYEQRHAIKEAGMIAGLNFLQIISAPAASAIFYGSGRLSKNSGIFSSIARYVIPSEPMECNMLIFDLGAGSLDVALVTIKDDICKVQATAGGFHLGGSDFDNNMVDYFVNSLKKSDRDNMKRIPMAISNLKTFCEKAKISLSSDNVVPLKIPLYNDVTFESSITRVEFKDINNELFIKCVSLMQKCLKDAKVGPDEVHEIILAGGSTRIPLVQAYISHYFRRKEVNISPHLETANAYGAAFQAFFLYRRENERANHLSLIDVTPFNLGLSSVSGTMLVCVKKNMAIPANIIKTFTFHPPNRAKFMVEVYEGDARLTCENNLLAKIDLTGVYGSPTESEFNVCFDLHDDGTLTVSAENIYVGMRIGTITTYNNLEDSKKRVWEALLFKEGEKNYTKASTNKILTRSGTFWDQMRGKRMLGKLLSMEKESAEKTTRQTGQSSRPYVEPEEYAIGIDFGTTHSSVAVWQRNGVKVIENEYSNRLTCSAVAFTDSGRLIGDSVQKEQVTTNPANTVLNIKRLIGRNCSDKSVHNDRKFLPFQVIRGKQNRPMVSVNYKVEEKLLAPEEIAAMILSKMKEIAEAYLNKKVSKAVISVPSSFNSFQRKAIKDAGGIAGLVVLQLLNETTTAAIGYLVHKLSGQSYSEKTVLIFDLGGGNLDVSIVMIKDGTIRVRAVAGDTNLGGEDFDNNMVSYFVQKFMTEKNKDISNKPRSLRRLRAACEKGKRVLSTNAQAVVEVDALDEGIDFRTIITQKEFEELNDGLFKKSISCVERCLEDAKMDKSCINEVVLVGGSTRIPKMQQLLQEFFNGKELCKSINADEAVVYGAAVQAAILCGNEDGKKFNILKLEDVTTASFWHVYKDGETMNLLIPKHTPIPAKKELILSNCSDNLSSFSIKVEERELASMEVQDCEFRVSGIAQKMRGSSRIELAFEVDSSGILNLTGKDVNGGEEKEIVISKDNCGLTVEEIQKMSEAAARYKAEDEEYKKRADALNSLENLAYKIKAIARDPKVSPSDKKRMDDAADLAIKWIDDNHNAAIDEINISKKKLNEALQKEVSKPDLDVPSYVPDGPN